MWLDVQGIDGKFIDLTERLKLMRETFEQIIRQIERLEAVRPRPKRSPSAEAVYTALTDKISQTDKPISLIQLKKTLSSWDNNQLWRALEELQREHIIHIEVSILKDWFLPQGA